MRIGQRLLYAVTVLLLVLPGSSYAALQESGATVVTSTLTIDAPAAEYPRIRAGLEVEADEDARWVDPLTRWADEDSRYESGLRELLGTYAGEPELAWPISLETTDETSNPGFVLGTDVDAPPRPRPQLSSGRATVAVSAQSRLWNFACRELGLWRVCGTDADEYRITSRPIPWTLRGEIAAETRFQGLEVVAVHPVPDRRVGHASLSWELGPEVEAEQIRIRVRPASASTAALLDSNSGLWLVFGQPASHVLTLLTIALAFLFVLHRRKATSREAWRPLALACRVAIAFGVLAFAAWSLYLARYNPVDIPQLPWALPAAGAIGTLVLVGLIAVTARPRLRHRAAWWALTLLFVLGMIAWTLASVSGDRLAPSTYGAARTIDNVLAIGAFAVLLAVARDAAPARGDARVRLASAVVVTALAVAAWLARDTVSVWPFVVLCHGIVVAAVVWWVGGAWILGHLRGWWLAGAVAAGAGVSLLAWELFLRRADATIEEQRAAAGYARDSNFWNPPLGPLGHYRELAAGDLPPDLLIAAITFVPFGLLTAAAAALYREARTSVLFADESPAPAVLLIAFGGFVGGMWDWLFEIRIPLAIVLFLLIVAVVGRRWWTPSGPTLCVAAVASVRRTELLAQPDAEGNGWRDLACTYRLQVRRASRGRLVSALRRVQQGFLPPEPVDPADDEPARSKPMTTPGRVALGLGPGRTWWGNGLAAVKVGSVLALVPAAHYLYILADAEAAVTVREHQHWPLRLLEWLMYEYAFWLVAAFVLGALLPYLPGSTGVLKGATLGALFGLTEFASHLLPGPYDVLGWLFIAASTTLYLCVVGFVTDLVTLRSRQLGWSAIGTHYGAPHARDVLAYALPLVILVGWVLQQALSGEAERAVGEFFQLAPQLVPQAR